MSVSDKVSKALVGFVSRWQQLVDEHIRATNPSLWNFYHGKYRRLQAQEGRKYAKILAITQSDAGVGEEPRRSVMGFVDLANGDIYRAVAWDIPATKPVGNILSEDGGLSGITPHGVIGAIRHDEGDMDETTHEPERETQVQGSRKASPAQLAALEKARAARQQQLGVSPNEGGAKRKRASSQPRQGKASPAQLAALEKAREARSTQASEGAQQAGRKASPAQLAALEKARAARSQQLNPQSRRGRRGGRKAGPTPQAARAGGRVRGRQHAEARATH